MPVLVGIGIVRRGVRQIAVANAYRAVSGRLGLYADTRGVSLHGFLGHRRIWIGEVMVRFGRERRTEVRGVLGLTRPLGLGLWVRRRGLPSRALRRRRVGPQVPVAERTVDRLFHVNGDDPARVRALLTPAVVEALVALSQVHPQIAVTDVDVRVAMRAAIPREEDLFVLVQRMVRLAEALEAARLEVAAPEPAAAWAARWRGVGERAGLGFEDAGPGLVGTIGAASVWVTAAREPDGYRANLTFWFAPHEEVGLVVRSAGAPDEALQAVGQDIVIGASDFDATWVIKGWDPDEVRLLLVPAARDALTALGRRGLVTLDDRVLHVTGLDADDVDGALTEASALAAALGWGSAP